MRALPAQPLWQQDGGTAKADAAEGGASSDRSPGTKGKGVHGSRPHSHDRDSGG